jgi:flagellar basal-body rod protein FlgB
MTMLDRMTATLDYQGQALALRAERQAVLATNIANADTPNYKARDIDFATALARATGTAAPAAAAQGGATGPSLALARTAADATRGHLPVGSAHRRDPERAGLSDA